MDFLLGQGGCHDFKSLENAVLGSVVNSKGSITAKGSIKKYHDPRKGKQK